MAVSSREKKIIITLLILIIVSFFSFLIGYLNYLKPKLGDFKIIGMEEKEELYLSVAPSHNAIHYETIVKDKEGEEIYKTTSETNEIPLPNLLANHGDNLTFEVFAKNKNGDIKSSEETLEYTWEEASFVSNNGRYLDTTNGLTLNLYGYIENTTYIVKLEYRNTNIYEEKIETDHIYIPYEKLNGCAGRVTAKLYTEENRLISNYNFYINTPVVGKIKITSPENELRDRHKSLTLTFEGGENATDYNLLIFEEGILKTTYSIPTNTKTFEIPKETWEEEKNYYLQLEANYLDYEEIKETDAISIFIGKKETTAPVYVNHNPSFIKSGTKITLNTRTPNSIIYYTIDGSEPNTESYIYKEPITIQSNVTLKTYAVSSDRYDSEINTYEFKIQERQLVVYLSPSNQSSNYGNKEAGYTTEMKEMNRLTDVIERILKENGVKVYRNRSSNDINTHLSESNYVKSDLHLAIHSNASKTNARGIEIYIDSPTSKSLSIATNIYENLYHIYPGKNIPNTNRGVKYANGALGEANDHFIPCGALIEVAYHDNYEDAKWLLEKREEIGNNIATSILLFYN